METKISRIINKMRMKTKSARSMCVFAVVLMAVLTSQRSYASHFYCKLTVESNNTAAGLVYASPVGTISPENYDYFTESKQFSSEDLEEKDKTYTIYAWAKAKRGSAFSSWSHATADGHCSNASITVSGTSPKKYVLKTGEAVNNNGDAVYKATASFTTYTKTPVTFHSSDYGFYDVEYSYTSYNESGKYFVDNDGFSFTISQGEADHVENESYQSDKVHLRTSAANFEGWYSDADFSNSGNLLSTSRDYIYQVPNGGEGHVYAKFTENSAYYSRLKLQMADESAEDAGSIMASEFYTVKEGWSVAPDYAKQINQTSNATSHTYYVHARETDPRYKFRGWYKDNACTILYSTDLDCTYTITGASDNSGTPKEETLYACFDRVCSHFIQVDALPGTPGLGMVLVNDEKYPAIPHYSNFVNISSKTIIVNATNETTNGKVYLYAMPKYGYKLEGWYTNAACTAPASVTKVDDHYEFTDVASSTDPLRPTKHTFYAKFVVDATFNVTYAKPENGQYEASVLDIIDVDGEYVWGQTKVYSSIGQTAATVDIPAYKTNYLTLSATPDAGYKVSKWTDGSDVTTASWVYETKLSAAKNVGVTFATTEPYQVGNNKFVYLQDAIEAAGSNGTIIVVEDAYVPAGTYTIPSGVKLLVPHNSNNKWYSETPAYENNSNNVKTRVCYRTLTLAEGANIIVNGGAICVSANLHARNGGQMTASTLDNYARIHMRRGSHIDMQGAAKLYAWGYITGTGTIDIRNGVTVYEVFQFDFRGGTHISDVMYDAFPMSQYFVQNVEAPMTFHYGASENFFTCCYAQYALRPGSGSFIGANGLFQLAEGATLTKSYDGLTDRQLYELTGSASIKDIIIDVSIAKMQSKDYILPITNNMDIHVHSGTTTIYYDMALLTGARLIVDHGAKIQAQQNIYIYDRDEWVGKNFGIGADFNSIPFSPTKSYTRTNDNLNDAQVIVNGDLETTATKGHIYTTKGGAAIRSEKGGIATFANTAGTNFKTQQSISTSSLVGNVAITPAQLQNWDESYTPTASAPANSTYYHVRGFWMHLTYDNTDCFYHDEQDHLFVHTDDFIEVIPSAVYPAAWQATDCEDLVYIHTDATCAWVPTHTVAGRDDLLKGMEEEEFYQYNSDKGYWEIAPKWNVTFKNFNGKVLEKSIIYNGGTPTYSGYTPVRPTDDNGTYSFTGWSPAIGSVTADVEYTAQYSCTPHEASVTAYALTTYYPTIEEAFAAAKEKSDATIKLLRTADIGATRLTYDVAKTCTLDLNGQTISGSQEIRLLVINHTSAIFTVTDLTESKSGTLSLSASTTNQNDAAFCACVEKGKLYLEAGTISLYSESTYKNAVGVRSQAGATFIMNGGTVHTVMTQEERVGYGVQSLGTATISGGTVRAESANGTGYGMYISGSGTITVTGGKFYVDGATASVINTSASNSNMLIQGGYYNTSNGMANYVAPGKSGWNYHSFALTEAEKVEVGSEYNYKVVEAYTLNWTTDGDALTGTYPTGVIEVDAPIAAPNTPTKTGYKFDAWSPEFTGTMPATNTTYTATWTPNTNTPYTVEHYKQKLDGSYAVTPDETNNLTGTTAMSVTPAVKEYTGFTAPDTQTEAIAADGSLVITYYYTRNSNLLTWNLGGGKVTTAGTAAAIDETSPSGMVKYEAPITAPVVAREGYNFTGWDAEVAETMPAAPATYTATWAKIVGNIEVGGVDNEEKSETINENSEAITTIVHSDAVLDIEGGSTLSTNTFIIEAISEVTDTDERFAAAHSSSGEATGNIEADVMYFDLILNNPSNRRWNAFTVPFVVDLRKSGHPIHINGETLTLGRGYDIIYYNGATRAAQGPVAACWEYVEDPAPNGGDSILYPGKAYMIASASRAIQIVRFTKATDPDILNLYDGKVSVAANATALTTGNNGGWNGIGNPTMYHAVMNAGVTLCQVHDGGLIGSDGYRTYDMKDKKLYVGKAVFVQVGSNNNDVSVVQATDKDPIKPQTNAAPRHRTREQIMEDRYDVQIAANGSAPADRLLILAEEDKEDQYVILKDLSKAGVSPVRAQMWVDRYGEKLCMNTTALINNKATYPLTISIPKAGEYDIFVSGEAKEGTTLYLTYDGRAIWNLTYGGYMASFEKGTDTHYGLLIVKKAPEVATGIEETTILNGDAIRKVIVDDKIFVIRGNNVYSIDGQLIR